MYEQGCILLPHIASLAFSIGPKGEVTSLYPHSIISTLHVISSSIISLGGLYHTLSSSDRLEESTYGLLLHYNWQDRFRITAILGAHLLILGCASLILFIKAIYLSGVYDTWSSGGGDVRSIKKSDLSLNPYVLARYLARPPFSSSGWILSVNNIEDLVGGHYWIAFYLIIGGIWHIQTRPLPIIQRGYTWSGEAYLSYSLSTLALCGFITTLPSWYNNTAYPSEVYGPTGPEASQAQSFTFLVRDTKLGVKVSSREGPTALGKYLMRSPTGEIIFGGETMRFWSIEAQWIEGLRSSLGIDLTTIQSDIQSWQERRSSEYMTHTPLGSLNSVAGVATEINSISYLSPRSWLTCSHWVLSYLILVGHWWHTRRARASALSSEDGLSRLYVYVNMSNRLTHINNIMSNTLTHTNTIIHQHPWYLLIKNGTLEKRSDSAFYFKGQQHISLIPTHQIWSNMW